MSRAAPVRPPRTDAGARRNARERCWPSSRRYPTLLEIEPAAKPTVFDTFAVSGGTPMVTSVEKVTKVPAPTMALTPPAARPAASTARISHQLTTGHLAYRSRRLRDHQREARAPPCQTPVK